MRTTVNTYTDLWHKLQSNKFMLTFTEISLFSLILKHWYQYQYDMIPISDILVHINYRCVEKGKDVGQRSNMKKKYH